MGGTQQNLAYRWYGRNSVCKALEDCVGKTRAATVLYLVVAFVVAGIVELLGKI